MIIRIERLHLKNIQNIEDGEIYLKEYNNLSDGYVNELSNYIGLFGPNGSGKTTILYALHMLKSIITGDRVFRDLIKNDSEKASCSVSILLMDEESDFSYLVDYTIEYTSKGIILEEFIVKEFYEDAFSKVLFDKQYLKSGKYTSEVFNPKMLSTEIGFIIEILYTFAKNKFKFIDSSVKDVVLDYSLWGIERSDNLQLITDIITYDTDTLDVVTKVNKVLKELIDAQIVFDLINDNECLVSFLFKDRKVRFSKESLGNRKIFNLLLYLIPLSSQSDFCLCVDEIDSSIYDMMTLALLKSSHNSFGGQLIFTSHQFSLINPMSKYNLFFMDKGQILEFTEAPVLDEYLKFAINSNSAFKNSTKVSLKMLEVGGFYE